MSKDCSIEFNSQLYPGFIDLHGLPSDSGVSTLKMTLGHMQQVQHQALAVKGKIEKYWQNCLTLVAISIGVAWQRCLKSCPVYRQFEKLNTVDIFCVYILKSQGPHLQSPLMCRYHYVILNSIGLNWAASIYFCSLQVFAACGLL